jgi:FixJ family two-component response regulator
VDDDQSVRTSLANLLETEDYTVDCRQRGDVVSSRARLAKLTTREFEVFRSVIAGLLNKETGAELGVTLCTIKTRRARVMHKMDAVSVADLVSLAQKAGIAPARHGPKGP